MAPKEVLVLVDSGACTGVSTPTSFPDVPIDPFDCPGLRGIEGTSLKVKGRQLVPLNLPSGRECVMRFAASNAGKDAMSVDEANDNGFTVVFSPEARYITKESLQHVAKSQR